MTDKEAMKLALFALDIVKIHYTQSRHINEAITALKERLADPMREVQRLGQEIEQEPVAWRNAAIRVGEDLSSVGPDGYYDMTAQQWLDWSMAQEPRGKNSLAHPEQEPVAWLLTDKNINSLQVDSIQRLINRLNHAHHTDLCVRINGQDEWFQADWLKHMVRATPPQRTEQNFCSRCGKRTKDIHTCTPPKENT